MLDRLADGVTEPQAREPLVDQLRGARQSLGKLLALRAHLGTDQPRNQRDDPGYEQDRDHHGNPYRQAQMLVQDVADCPKDGRHHHRAEQQREHGPDLPQEEDACAEGNDDQRAADEPPVVTLRGIGHPPEARLRLWRSRAAIRSRFPAPSGSGGSSPSRHRS
jgi:hypothetical protein